MTSIMELASAASISGVIIVLAGISIYLLRNKRKETK
jgi:LPXTG-motif cell wall-anchored protein